MDKVFKKKPTRITRFMKNFGHHIIFSFSLLALILLVIWWSIFISNSIYKNREQQFQNLELSLNFYHLKLVTDETLKPETGNFDIDSRFEITTFCENITWSIRQLSPRWANLYIRVKPALLITIEKDFRSKKIMVIGESIVFFLVILFSLLFLYRFIQTEKRTTREITDFWERITHEIKTPITGIKALFQSIKNRSLGEEDLIPAVDLALEQVRRQEQLSENMLAGAYLKYKGSKSDLIAVNIKEFIENYCRHHPLLTVDNNISIHLEAIAASKVIGDPYGLKVIFDNLVDNAVKYCPQNLKLDIYGEVKHNMINIFFRDNGPGLNDEMREIIFEAYRSNKNGLPRKNQGSGLGLNISRNMARNMMGELKATNRNIQPGAEFCLSLSIYLGSKS